jgi:hypothetical protein
MPGVNLGTGQAGGADGTSHSRERIEGMEPGAKEREMPVSTERRRAQVLRHPLRARIAAELEKRSMDLPELAETLGEPVAVVDYHRDVLAKAGLT